MLRLPSYQELTKPQTNVVNLPLEGTHLVVGPPGTGKTVIALHRAGMFERNRKQSWFLVFNRMLNQYLNSAIETLDLGNRTFTFHSWFCKWYLQNLHKRAPTLPGNSYKFDWDRVFKDLSELGDFKKLTHLIIDEGQDFSPKFYKILRLIATNVTVFADENQRLTDENSTIEEIQKTLRPEKTHYLKQNFRNSRQIAEFASCFYADLASGTPDLPNRQGIKPTLSVNRPIEKQAETISNIAVLHPDWSIGVFLFRKDPLKHLYDQVVHKLNRTGMNIPVQIYLREEEEHREVDFAQNGIKMFAYASSKGLEFDAVFLPGLDELRTDANTYDQKMRFFVLTSRARDELHLLSAAPGIPGLMQHVPANLYTIR